MEKCIEMLKQIFDIEKGVSVVASKVESKCVMHALNGYERYAKTCNFHNKNIGGKLHDFYINL